MSKQVVLMILVNVFAGFLFFLGNLDLWNRVNYWVLVNVASQWSPFFVTSKYLGTSTTPSYSPIYNAIINYPFLIFWFLLAINLLFLIKIERSKETS
jgi:hypothetical protein